MHTPASHFASGRAILSNRTISCIPALVALPSLFNLAERLICAAFSALADLPNPCCSGSGARAGGAFFASA